MQYASAQDMKDRYPDKDLRELTDENAAVVNDAALDLALADASAEIDSYLQGRYALPLAAVPPAFLRFACEIAFYQLMKSRPTAMVEDAKNRYDKAIAFLRDVGRGTLALVMPAGDTAAQDTSPTIVTGSRQFTRDAMRGL